MTRARSDLDLPASMSAEHYRAYVAAPAKQTGPGAAYRALGRLKAGDMNKTEQAYDAHLWAQRQAGTVLWHKFEPFKLRLADRTFFDVDFLVLMADRTIELHDVKGARHLVEEDARVKIKVAAETFPLFGFATVYPVKGKTGGWDKEVFA